MKRHLRSLRAASGALCVFASIGAIALAAGASADVVDTLWIDEDNFQYRVTHMPDFDQRRLETETIPGLPNTGSMYCVPSSTMNVLGYIANHGFPSVPPEQNNWTDPSKYNLATGSVFIFGLLMNTSPTGGTGVGGWKNGIEALLPLDKFTYTMYAVDSTYTPTFKDMGISALNGSLVHFAHGWYTEEEPDDGVPVITRGGGHCLTMTRAYAALFNDNIYIRDPADDPANTTQSAYKELIYEVQNRTVYAHGTTRVMSNLQTTPGTWSSRYLDVYAAIRPKAGYSFTNTGIIYHIAPLRIWDSSPDPILTIEAVADVFDVIIGPDQNNIYYVGRDGIEYRLYCANLQSRETVPIDVGPVTIPPQIVFGRRRILYELSGRSLFYINPADPGSAWRITLPGTGEAIAYDDMHDQIAIMDVDTRNLFIYPHHLDADPIVQPLPPAGSLPLGNNVMMTWDAFRDAWWATSEESDDVFQFKMFEAGWFVTKINHEVLVRPTSVDVDDAGHVFVVAEGRLHEFEEQDEDWILVEDSPFADAPVGKRARITKCRTNYDPIIHEGELWRNVLPTTFGEAVRDCPADLDLSGAVDFADILAVIVAWGPCPPDHYCDEDLDFSGAADFADLLRVLTDWGPCP